MRSIFYVIIITSLQLLCDPCLADPPTGGDWVAFEPMTDEFNGDQLDQKKWLNKSKNWAGRQPVYFHPDCLELRDGKLIVSAMDSTESAKLSLPDGYTHASGFVTSRQLVRFGYFEIRAKLMDSSLVSCFWLSNHASDEWSELDCVEVAAGVEAYAKTIRPNLHYFYGPHYRGTLQKHIVDPSATKLPFRMADDFHVYGVQWSPTHLRWYVDGELIRETKNTLLYQPLRMNINLEANAWFDALPDDSRLPGSYEVDWVRTWRLAPENTKPNASQTP